MLDRQTEAVALEIQRDASGLGDGLCVITVTDPELLGHHAELTLTLHAEVVDSRPVHARKVLFRASCRLDHPRTEIVVPESALCCYSYRGTHVHLKLQAELSIDDGILFDSKARAEQELPLPGRPAVRGDAKEMIEPDDAFDFATNFKVLAPRHRRAVLVLLAIGLVFGAVNTFLGIHDQFSPEELTYFYSHVSSDGDSQSPLFGSLFLSSMVGGGVWLAIRQQLKKYMHFELVDRQLRRPVRRDTVVPAASLVHGVARCDLRNVTVRVVAANRERGQYKRGSGTQERTVTFSTPVRAVLLYERHLHHVPAGSPLEGHLEGDVAFEPMFAALYPPLAVGKNHGIDVVWEVQLLHPELVDQELPGNRGVLPYEEFLEG